MKVLPVANVMVVLTSMIATVNSSRPDTCRPVACRQAVADSIQTMATIIAVVTPKSTRVVVKRTAGATTAVTRLTATRRTTSRRCGGAAGAAGLGARVASRVTVTVRPAPGTGWAGCLVVPRNGRAGTRSCGGLLLRQGRGGTSVR